MSDRGLWKKEYKSAQFKFLAGLPIFLIMAVAIPLSYDYLTKILQTTPIPGVFNEQAEQLKNYTFYIWSQWFGKNLTQFGTILALIFGASLITTEASRKTIYFLLAKPIAREKVYFIKYMASLLSLEGILLVSSLVLYGVVLSTGKNYPMASFLENQLLISAGAGLMYTIAMYCSNFFDQSMKAFLSSGLIAFLLSVPGYFESAKTLSVFYYMRGEQIISNGGFPWLPFIVMSLISGMVYFMGMRHFVRRDW